ncbi:MAG: hypothetical protein A2173_03870 [Planctomycetes bacterium RBG_13_44_8b]|nr:MAG: hypothetical protein A2173_03870 [Planctomycetes bacterium RBG_13_44_8b]
MDQQCDNCGQKDSCQTIYQKLGSSKSPPITLKVVQAFLLPLVLFVIALTVAEKLLAERVAEPLGKNVLALVTAAVVISLYLLILKLWRNRH